ncbi:hypothetical protein D3C80_2004250 [compost metagenome]
MDVNLNGPSGLNVARALTCIIVLPPAMDNGMPVLHCLWYYLKLTLSQVDVLFLSL